MKSYILRLALVALMALGFYAAPNAPTVTEVAAQIRPVGPPNAESINEWRARCREHLREMRERLAREEFERKFREQFGDEAWENYQRLKRERQDRLDEENARIATWDFWMSDMGYFTIYGVYPEASGWLQD